MVTEQEFLGDDSLGADVEAVVSRCAVGLIGGLAVCLVVCLLNTPVSGLMSGPDGSVAYRLAYRVGQGLAAGLATGVGGGLVFRLTAAPQHTDLRCEADSRSCCGAWRMGCESV